MLEPDIERFSTQKAKQDELVDYAQLTPVEVGGMEPRPPRRRSQQVATAAPKGSDRL